MRRNLVFKKAEGLTLLEILISTAIFILVATSISFIFNRSLFVYRATSEKNRVAQETQTAIEYPLRDIQSAYAIVNAQTQGIALVVPDAYPPFTLRCIQYYFDNGTNTLQRRECGNPNHLLAEGVTNLSFRYYDIHNQQLTDPVNNLLSLKTVEIDITARRNNQEFRLNTVAWFEHNSGCPWAKAYDVSGNDDNLSWLNQTPDEGYILAGDGGVVAALSSDALATKIDASARASWAKAYDVAGSLNDRFYSGGLTADGGYVFVGNTNPIGGAEILVIKTDAQGRVGSGATGTTWARLYGNASQEYGVSVQQTQDKKYIIGSYFYVTGTNRDNQLIKVSSSGTRDWAKRYKGYRDAINEIDEQLRIVRQTRDKGYIFGGFCFPGLAYGSDFLVVKTNAAGDVGPGVSGTWAKAYGGKDSSPREEELYCLQQTQDGGYILGGYTTSFGAGSNFYLIKIDASGAIQWARTYGGSATDELYFLQQTNDGGYILGGRTTSFGTSGTDLLIIKTDASGDVVNPVPAGTVTWAKTFGGTNFEQLNCLQQTPDGGYILGGITTSFGMGGWPSGYDSLAVRMDSLGNIAACSYVTDVTASLTVLRYSNDGNSSNDDFTPDSDYPIDLVAGPMSYHINVSTPTLATYEYPDTTTDPNFTLTTREYDGNAPDDFILTTTPICPVP